MSETIDDTMRFVRTAPLLGGRNRRPECEGFPANWADLVWGLDDEADQQARREAMRFGAMVCRECPVRIECLASAIVQRERSTLKGGLSWTTRKRIAHLAEKAGVPLQDNDLPAKQRYVLLMRWLASHPHAEDQARRQENEQRTNRRRRTSRPRIKTLPRVSPGVGQSALFD
ncbi:MULTISPECIES: WhiB family transcriptional regulator [Bifidobacterium]|uniref:WhiB family transcriptional regulator n=2 Tax=Bifidobacterium TaxID=1678 RepID=A0A261FU75_9BIFI|nr:MULTISPECIES: WhiB family transcriptional regulator [Bifidobacterium]OZG62495.1 WhiB family transcriptional regulator [Bifidobacterium lemurum]OZG69031.1 WhiB family transcriptional regulator [Bifidobacterium eulemuris]QOL31441.1 WhiB family transcriptional regulator [Bifidobacterium eulemuris]QOL33836.1 WhiB family transcriptional regulator [Bifidobacterium lemurum]